MGEKFCFNQTVLRGHCETRRFEFDDSVTGQGTKVAFELQTFCALLLN